MGAVKHGDGGHYVALFVRRKGFQLIAAVGEGAENPFHPIGIAGDGGHFGQGAGLAREGGIVMTPSLACLPALTGFAGFEEIPCGLFDRHCFGLSILILVAYR